MLLIQFSIRVLYRERNYFDGAASKHYPFIAATWCGNIPSFESSMGNYSPATCAIKLKKKLSNILGQRIKRMGKRKSFSRYQDA